MGNILVAQFHGEGYQCDTSLKGPLFWYLSAALSKKRGGWGRGGTLCGLGKWHSNRWLDATARGPLFFFFLELFLLFFPVWLPDPMIPIWVSVRAAIHHWLDYLVGREQRAIHLSSWHNSGQRDAELPALPLQLEKLSPINTKSSVRTNSPTRIQEEMHIVRNISRRQTGVHSNIQQTCSVSRFFCNFPVPTDKRWLETHLMSDTGEVDHWSFRTG